MGGVELELPEDLRGRYRIERLLGEGGFGQVLAVTDLELSRPVALKLLHAELGSEDQRARFVREARVTAGIEHPGVVRVFDHGITSRGHPWIAYELIEGEDLGRRRGTYSPEGGADALAPVAGALDAAHAAGVVHRDVKPPNLFLRPSGEVALGDFGIARVAEGGVLRTATGLILGTPDFLAPEIWLGAPASAASDQFALAVTFLELVLGRGLYVGEDPVSIMKEATAGRPMALPAELPPAVAGALSRALDSDPARRYPDCASLIKALRGEGAAPPAAIPGRVGDTLVVGSAISPAPEAPAPASSGSRPFLLGGVGFAGLLLVAAVLTREGAPPARMPPPPTAAPPTSELAEAADALEVARTRVEESLLEHVPDLELVGKDAEVERVHPALMDPRFPLRWARYLRALQAWIVEAGRAGTFRRGEGGRALPGLASFETRDQPLLQGILDHIGTMRLNLEAGTYLNLHAAAADYPPEWREGFVRLESEVSQKCGAALGDALEALDPESRVRGGAVLVDLALRTDNPRRGSILREQLAAVRPRAGEPWVWPELRHLLEPVLRFQGVWTLTCETRRGLLRTYAEMLVDPDGRADPRRKSPNHALLLAEVLARFFGSEDGCGIPEEGPGSLVARLLGDLAEVPEAGVDELARTRIATLLRMAESTRPSGEGASGSAAAIGEQLARFEVVGKDGAIASEVLLGAVASLGHVLRAAEPQVWRELGRTAKSRRRVVSRLESGEFAIHWNRALGIWTTWLAARPDLPIPVPPPVLHLESGGRPWESVWEDASDAAVHARVSMCIREVAQSLGAVRVALEGGRPAEFEVLRADPERLARARATQEASVRALARTVGGWVAPGASPAELATAAEFGRQVGPELAGKVVAAIGAARRARSELAADPNFTYAYIRALAVAQSDRVACGAVRAGLGELADLALEEELGEPVRVFARVMWLTTAARSGAGCPGEVAPEIQGGAARTLDLLGAALEAPEIPAVLRGSVGSWVAERLEATADQDLRPLRLPAHHDTVRVRGWAARARAATR